MSIIVVILKDIVGAVGGYSLVDIDLLTRVLLTKGLNPSSRGIALLVEIFISSKESKSISTLMVYSSRPLSPCF